MFDYCTGAIQLDIMRTIGGVSWFNDKLSEIEVEAFRIVNKTILP